MAHAARTIDVLQNELDENALLRRSMPRRESYRSVEKGGGKAPELESSESAALRVIRSVIE